MTATCSVGLYLVSPVTSSGRRRRLRGTVTLAQMSGCPPHSLDSRTLRPPRRIYLSQAVAATINPPCVLNGGPSSPRSNGPKPPGTLAAGAPDYFRDRGGATRQAPGNSLSGPQCLSCSIVRHLPTGDLLPGPCPPGNPPNTYVIIS